MPSGIRIKRIEDRIQQELSEMLIHEVSDPRLKQIFVNLPVDGLGTVVGQRAERRVPYGHVNGKGCNPQIDRQEPKDESPPKEGGLGFSGSGNGIGHSSIAISSVRERSWLVDCLWNFTGNRQHSRC